MGGGVLLLFLLLLLLLLIPVPRMDPVRSEKHQTFPDPALRSGTGPRVAHLLRAQHEQRLPPRALGVSSPVATHISTCLGFRV